MSALAPRRARTLSRPPAPSSLPLTAWPHARVSSSASPTGPPSFRAAQTTPSSLAIASSAFAIKCVIARWETAITPTRRPSAARAAMHLAAVYVLPAPGGPCTHKYDLCRASTVDTVMSTGSAPTAPEPGHSTSAIEPSACITRGTRRARISPSALRLSGAAAISAASSRSAVATGLPSTNSLGSALMKVGGSVLHSMTAVPFARSRESRLALSVGTGSSSPASADGRLPSPNSPSSRSTREPPGARLHSCNSSKLYSYARRRLRGAAL